MNIHDLEKLEYPKILESLAHYCTTYLGKHLAKELLPSNNKEEVKQLLAQTQEAVILITRNSAPSFYDIQDITKDMKNIESNIALSASSIYHLARIFQLAENLKKYIDKDFLEATDFPIMNALFRSLYTNKNVIDKVFSCITEDYTIDDRASKELQSIRKKQRNLEQDIRSKLNEFIHSSKYAKFIQENIITIRNDRFVIPIKEEYRSQVKGFIHDVSNAGSTVFIEPISIFEMNNTINELKGLEEIEIERILSELTFLFSPYIESLVLDVSVIGQLDFIFAKAKYARATNSITPMINDEKYINLKNARHPLIPKEKIVPISISLGDTYSTLLITGPNTGGKTVTLKTVGLLSCMACSGLNIPCDEPSSIYVFDNIFIDIGDEQSISDSLSTFSSHMLTIVDIIKQANENSLILVDELGSGTDPLEGANLAISILDYFQNKQALTIATTHYQELKQYALVTNGFENASVEFDIQTLSPTYKLLVGIPGKSNAFAISQKLGLDTSIIEKAKSMLTTQEINIEELLKNIYDDKSQIEKEKLEIQAKLKEIDTLKASLEKENTQLHKQEQERINQAKVEARNILLDAKEEATQMIKKMQHLSNTNELQTIRNELNDTIKNIRVTNTGTKNGSHPLMDRNDIKPNTEVFVTTLNQHGIVVSNISRSDEVQVQIGSMKMTLPIASLAPAEQSNHKQNKQHTNKNTGYTSISKTRNAKTEINLLGYNVEEAIFVVDKFLDDCALAKLETVRIVHGKGTGKLKNGIHQFLKNHPHVASYRLGVFGEGEMGVTVVTLK